MQAIWSEHWHAVRGVRPRLRDGVRPLHRWLRGRPWVLLADPLTQRHHRLPPSLWHVIELFDGRRTLDEIWAIASAVPADQPRSADRRTAQPPLSQHELVQLLASLHANDLLQSQLPPDAGEVVERWKRHAGQRWKQSWLNPLNLRVTLLYPDAWFTRRARLARAVFSWPVAALWLACVAPAAVLAWQHWDALTGNLTDRVLAADNLVLLWFVYPVVKAVHECAHGLAVKAFGGTVREIGVMFMIFTPVPYVDATSSYGFASKWQRALVAAAGIAAELVLGAAAMVVWLMAEPGLATAVAFNVVLIAGVSTLIVNGNPLMRYDGYFIACDLLEVPNMAQRASAYWTYLFDRWFCGARDAQPPIEVGGERALLAVYGVASPIYRLGVTFGLAWFVAAEYRLVGAVMALLAVWSALAVPVWRGWKHVARGPALQRRRGAALRRSTLALAALALLLFVLPVPFRSVHRGVVWVPDDSIVRAEVAGAVAEAPVVAGRSVAPRDVVLRLDSPTLAADRDAAAAALAQINAQLRQAEVESRAKAEALRDEAAARAARLVDAESRVERLDVRAVRAGRWTPKAQTELAGRYVKRGEVVGWVVGDASRTVRAAIPQEDMALIDARLRGVEVRLVQRMGEPIAARFARRVPGGEFELVSPALGTSGGGDIAVDPSKPNGLHTLKRVFDLEVALERPSPTAVFGDRAYVRFDLGHLPLAWQWFLRLRQTFLSRLDV